MSQQPFIFFIDGMTCISCSGTIESHLKNKFKNRLKLFDVDLTTPDPKKTTIILNDSEEQHLEIWNELKNSIEEIGFNCREYQFQLENKANLEKEKQINWTKFLIALSKKFFTSHWFLGGLGCIAGIAVLIACLSASTLSMPVMIPIALISTVLTLALGANSYKDAWSKLTKTNTLTMDSLFALSTISILVVSIASLFVPWLPMMFEAGLLIYGFRHIGIAIENTIKNKISSAKFQDRAPKILKKCTANGIEEQDLDLIKVDDIVLVQPGEIIPLDGICENESTVFTTIITGATLPRHFLPKDKVLAGMRMAENANPLKIRVTKDQKNSYLARLDAAIEASALEKAPIEIKTGQLLVYFIPTVIALAIASGIIIGLFFPAAIAIQCAVSVLISACPCTLGLITPLAVKTGMHKAAENGVQFKSAKALQQAEQINTVIFDLNGTLTTGVPVVKQLYVSETSQLTDEQFIALCLALEKGSKQPLGKAIYSFARKKSTQNLQADFLDSSHHSGVTGKILGNQYAIGSRTLMKLKGIAIPQEIENIEKTLAAGDQIVYMAREHTIIGCMVMTDPLRADAPLTINALKAMGKQIHLCTGADQQTAKRYAQALGIDHVSSECVATSMDDNQLSKTTYINKLRRQGHIVAMIGDAGNDAEAVVSSDLGIAIASDSGDELTQQAADIVIHTGTLLPIASAFAVSQQTVTNINQNLTMSLIYNIGSIVVSGGLLVALGITLSPVVGVALMITQACMILLNVYRFKQQAISHLGEDVFSPTLLPNYGDAEENTVAQTLQPTPSKPTPPPSPSPKGDIDEELSTFFSHISSPKKYPKYPYYDEKCDEKGTSTNLPLKKENSSLNGELNTKPALNLQQPFMEIVVKDIHHKTVQAAFWDSHEKSKTRSFAQTDELRRPAITP